MHLEIIQPTGSVEIVNQEVIDKLYNLSYENAEFEVESELDSTSNVVGTIQPTAAYEDAVIYLRQRFPQLTININNGDCYIRFADNNVRNVLLNNSIGDGVGITISTASTANFGTIFKNNTDITNFNEFDYFTRANTNPSNNMFEGCNNLISIDQSNITKLSHREFLGTGITAVNMPNLQTISDHEQFQSCNSLTTVQNLGDILSLGNSMFRYCEDLESVVLPNGITTIPIATFAYDYGLTTINLQNISVVGDEGFRECDLTNVNANTLSNLVSVGNYGFLLTKIYGVLNLPRLSSLASQAFDRCQRLTGIECLGTLSSIPNNRVFYGTGITYAKIPYECTNIGNSAFQGCSSLTSITQYNKSLNDYEEGETPTFTNIQRVTNIGIAAFYDCRLLTISLNLPNLVNLGRQAFMNSNISSIQNLGSNLTEIGYECFRGCSNLSGTVDLSNTKITSLEKGVFRNTSITGLILPSTLVTYGESGNASPLANVTTCTIFKGLENVTKFNNCETMNCTNALYLRSYVSGATSPLVAGESRSGSVPQMYFPAFTQSTLTSYGEYYGAPNQSFFSYRAQAVRTITMDLLYFKDLQTIQALFFNATVIKNLVINNTTPPVFDSTAAQGYNFTYANVNSVFGTNSTGANGMIIYVPDSAKATYQADSNYNNYVIRGIDEINPNTNLPYLTRYATEAAWEAAGKPADGLIEAYMS